MRIPRTNLTPASFAKNVSDTHPAQDIVIPDDGTGLERLRAIAAQLRAGQSTTWDNHFYLAPNVRFTRTPENVLHPSDRAPEGSAQISEDIAAQLAIEQDRTVSIPEIATAVIDEYPSMPATASKVTESITPQNWNALSLLSGRADIVSVATALNTHFAQVKTEPVAARIMTDEPPVPVVKNERVTQFSALSDFAFWEIMDADLSGLETNIPTTREVTEPVAMPPVAANKNQFEGAVDVVAATPASVSAIITTEAVVQKVEPASTPVPWAVTPILGQASGASLPHAPWLQRKTTTQEKPATSAFIRSIADVAATVPTPASDPSPVEKIQVESAVQALPTAPVVQPPQNTGVAISKPFRIESIDTTVPFAEGYEFPPRALLQDPPGSTGFVMTQEQLERNAGLLESILEDFGVRGEIIHVRPGPVVTLYEFEPAPGVKSSRVIGLADDIARSMSALSARVAVVPGRNVIGIELPNATREKVYFSELIDSQDFSKSNFKLPLCLGKAIGGEPVIAELAKMPHLLVAGTTGSGKSVAINTMILSLLYRLTPEECRLIMVDPKMLELSVYDGIPHLLTPVVTDPKKAVLALKWAVREMEDRYRKMARLNVRNIDGYNARAAMAREKGEAVTNIVQTGFDKGTGEPIFENQPLDLAPMPYIVVIVDEMADLMMVAGKEIEGAIQRLAQMARAAGIHLIMATQRPSVDVITGTIKANFPTRISFQVTSKIDSRTILGEQGAEQLLGQGDMLHMVGGGRICRVHGPFVSDEEVEQVVAHLKTQGRPEYLETVTTDETEDDEDAEESAVFDKSDMGAEDGDDLYDKAVKVVLRDKKCSTSYIQRRLGVGYNRAASLVERMEKEGLVGAANHVGKREIITGGYGAIHHDD